MLESPCKQCSSKETIIVMKNLFQYFQIMMFFVFAFILINLLIVQSLCLLNKEKLTVLLIIFSNLRQHQCNTKTRFEIYRSKHPVLTRVFYILKCILRKCRHYQDVDFFRTSILAKNIGLKEFVEG